MNAEATPTPQQSPPYGVRPTPQADTVLRWSFVAAAILAFLCTVLWGMTGGGTFWAGWVWYSLAMILSVEVLVWWLLRKMPSAEQRNAVEMGNVEALLRGKMAVFVWAAFVTTGNWLVSGTGTWILWAWLGFGGFLFLDWLGLREIRKRRADGAREEKLTERVEELSRTRRGALEVQAAELRRVERDLHDGAQSRLVALSMQLGRAEARLADDPEAAALVRQAREEAGAAITEIRDLARGIAPPVLADRGLEAAVRSLADRTGASVEVTSEIEGRAVPVVETAAYFTVAEALTNAAKHAPGAPVRVEMKVEDGKVVVVVSDEGPGGGDAAGSGVAGMRSRVEAVDGEFGFTSPPGGGTTVRAALPWE